MSKRDKWKKALAVWEGRRKRARAKWMTYVKAGSKSPKRAYWKARYIRARRRVGYYERLLNPIRGISARGLRLIRSFEGFRSRPYKDIAGVWTIGYGETKGIGPGTNPISQRKAARLLRARINRDYFPAVKALSTFRYLNQNQVDALCSFIYNVGPGGIGPGTGVGRALRARRWEAAADALLAWNKATVNGRLVSVPGLTRRRRAERKLFMR